MRDKILIIGDKLGDQLETSADFIAEKITDLGEYCIALSLSELVSKKSTLSVSYDNNGHSIILEKDNERIDLQNDIKSVLFWRPSLPDIKLRDAMKESTLQFYRGEWSNFMRGIYLSMRDRFWMNPYPMNLYYQDKVYQLILAQKIGFKIPISFITTSLNKAQNYFKNIEGEIVYKAFTQSNFEKNKKDGEKEIYMLYSNIIDRKDLNDSNVDYATPNIFQSYVPKKYELRITCVGKAVMACEIQSQKSEIAKHDWRHYDLENTPHLKHDLPKDIEELCLKYLHELDLTYGCIDMIVTPDGEYIFLELNPNGQFGWIEGMTEFPITENIARMLIKGSIDYDVKGWDE